LFVAVSGVLAAALAAVFLPVPYVILSPGPTLNTLGKGPGGRSLIQIAGHPTYPTSGHLNLVTVSFQGGPSESLNVFAALRAWLTPHEAVVPQEELFGPGQTQQQVVQQDTQQMTSSQQTATAAALCVLGIKFQVVDTVAAVEKGFPADGVVRRGDVITAVDGKPVTCKASAASLIRARSPGDPVTLTIARSTGGHRAIRHDHSELGRAGEIDFGGELAVVGTGKEYSSTSTRNSKVRSQNGNSASRGPLLGIEVGDRNRLRGDGSNHGCAFCSIGIPRGVGPT